MSSEDRLFCELMGLVALLLLAQHLQHRWLQRIDDDVRFLMDHTVTRETEARP